MTKDKIIRVNELHPGQMFKQFKAGNSFFVLSVVQKLNSCCKFGDGPFSIRAINVTSGKVHSFYALGFRRVYLVH